MPVMVGNFGAAYFGGALLLGGLFLASTIAFLRQTSTVQARRVLRASLLYLPLMLALMLLQGWAGQIAPALAVGRYPNPGR
jgi:protoheme IX farnesyltransferase